MSYKELTLRLYARNVNLQKGRSTVSGFFPFVFPFFFAGETGLLSRLNVRNVTLKTKVKA